MKILYRLIFIILLIPVGLIYLIGSILSVILYLPYWIITGDNFIIVVESWLDTLWDKLVYARR